MKSSDNNFGGIVDKFMKTMRMTGYENAQKTDYEDYDDDYDEYGEEQDKRVKKTSSEKKKNRNNQRSFRDSEEEEMDEFDDYSDDYYDEPSVKKEKPGKSRRASKAQRSFASDAGDTGETPSNLRSVRRDDSMNSVCMIMPKNFEDANLIADKMKEGLGVIMNLESLDIGAAQRIIDFASGACYALNGNLQKISKKIFLVVPGDVALSGDFEELVDDIVGLESVRMK